MPQSSNNFLPAASTRYLDPVTVPAAPRKGSFGMASIVPNARADALPSRFFNPGRDTTPARVPPQASPRAANPLRARAPTPPDTLRSPPPWRLPQLPSYRDLSRLSP